MIFDRYKIGDSFIHLPLEQAQSLLSTSTDEIDAEVSRLEDALGEIREELSGLKAALYARFGKAINLDVWFRCLSFGVRFEERGTGYC